MNKWILLIVSFFSFFAHAEDLNLKVSPSDIHAFPVSIRACASREDLPAPSFTFPNIQVSWAGKSQFQIVFLKVQLKSESLESGSYECQIAGDELQAMFPMGLKISPNMISTAMCGIRCGGLSIQPNQSNALMKGKITLIGVESLEDGLQRPLSAEVPVTVQYNMYR